MICTTSLNKPNTMLIFPDCLSGLALGRLAGLVGRHPWNCKPSCGLGAGSGAVGGSGAAWRAGLDTLRASRQRRLCPGCGALTRRVESMVDG